MQWWMLLPSRSSIFLVAMQLYRWEIPNLNHEFFGIAVAAPYHDFQDLRMEVEELGGLITIVLILAFKTMIMKASKFVPGCV